MINYSYPLYRPPAEGNNLILQVTHGCSYNQCSFCSMYKSKKYSVKPLEKIKEEIDLFALEYPDTIKIFLADGDALALETNHLLEILKYLQNSFLNLRRVSTYASASNILSKSVEDLKQLKENKLNLFYYGIETGDDTLLQKINKGVTSKEMIKSLNMASEAKIKISATVILGIGGLEYSSQHIQNTALLLNSTHINFLSTLQLGLDEDIKEKFYSYFEKFSHLSDTQILQEQRRFISLLEPKSKIIFRSNHASNALALEGNLPRDKQKLLHIIDHTLDLGEQAYIPQYMRGF